MDIELKTTLLGLVCAAMDGRPIRGYILKLDGDQCVEAHNLLTMMDETIKAQWVLMGAPDDMEIL